MFFTPTLSRPTRGSCSVRQQGLAERATLGHGWEAGTGGFRRSCGRSRRARPGARRARSGCPLLTIPGSPDSSTTWPSRPSPATTGEAADPTPLPSADTACSRVLRRRRVDHDSLGISLHQAGYCLASEGQFAVAQTWFERAVTAKEQGDIHGRVDHESLGRSLQRMGGRLLSQRQIAAAHEQGAFQPPQPAQGGRDADRRPRRLTARVRGELRVACSVLPQRLLKPNTGSPSASSGVKDKQPSQGAPAGFEPQHYGASAEKQKTQGAPAGFQPQHYGAGAGKPSQNQ